MLGQAADDRCGATSWPVVDQIVIRGVSGPVDVDAVTRRVLPGGTDAIALNGRPLKADQVRLALR